MTVADPVLHQYAWLVVVGALASWAFGYGTGANDVANAFGTSVGAKTLTLRQAVIIAAIFEFTGAMVLGRVSTSTIAGGIADINAFTREPEVFSYGMVCALSTSSVWQVVASYFELNVSSTHSIIGAIIGFALVYNGNDAVLWKVDDPASFPPYKGVVPIVVSWFFSPIFTALASAFFFFCCRTLVLRRENSHVKSYYVLPPAVIVTVFISIYFVFTKGAKKTLVGNDDTWTDTKSAWVSALIAAAMGIVVAVVVIPILRHRTAKKFNDDGTHKEAELTIKQDGEVKDAEAGADGKPTADGAEAEPVSKWRSAMNKGMKMVTHGTDVDIHAVVEEDELVNSIHAHAEVFDPRAEYAFQYLQVFSAICVVFAHGAGEVGYMAGPLATVWQMYTEGKLIKAVEAPVWVVFIGAFGLVIGLATYGYKVTRAMGVKLSKLSPTRGFCAELATALVIMIASQYGLPTSSSQCITGGIIGVGLMEGKLGVNWTFFLRQFSSWIATLFIVGISTATLFAQGLYAPGKIEGEAQIYYEDNVALTASTMFDNYRVTMESYRTAAIAGAIPGMTNASITAWSKALTKASADVKSLVDGKTQTASPPKVYAFMNMALSLYQSDTILTIGQTRVLPRSLQCNSNITVSISNGDLVACPSPKLLPKGVNVTFTP